jgi:hypothetical protein
MESSPLRVVSDSDSGATTVPVSKTAAPYSVIRKREYHPVGRKHTSGVAYLLAVHQHLMMRWLPLSVCLSVVVIRRVRPAVTASTAAQQC